MTTETKQVGTMLAIRSRFPRWHDFAWRCRLLSRKYIDMRCRNCGGLGWEVHEYFTIVHEDGTVNGHADTVSRCRECDATGWAPFAGFPGLNRYATARFQRMTPAVASEKRRMSS